MKTSRARESTRSSTHGRRYSPLILGCLAALMLLPLCGCITQTVRRARAIRSYVMQRAWEKDSPIEIGPLLGHAGPDWLTVTCRTDEDATVRLRVGSRIVESGPAEYHALLINRLPGGNGIEYFLDVQESEGKKRQATYGPFHARCLPQTAPFTFVAYGDPQANASVWRICSHRMMALQPSFAVALGDMVQNGPNKTEWEHGLYGPAREFFSQVPHLAVRGNHDWGGEKWFDLLVTPSGTYNWTQVIGPIRLVGIDILDDWDPDEKLYWWLQSVLARASEPYVFLAVHVPPWTSTLHGEIQDGHLRQRLTRLSRKVFVPLMERHHGTAILSGHAHCYERSELPSGLTCITSGGAGASLYDKLSGQQNPFSRTFSKAHHFLRFDVSRTQCTMQAVDLSGCVLDRRVWKPRDSRP